MIVVIFFPIKKQQQQQQQTIPSLCYPSVHELNLPRLLKPTCPFPSATPFLFGYVCSDTTCPPQTWVSGPTKAFLKTLHNCFFSSSMGLTSLNLMEALAQNPGMLSRETWRVSLLINMSSSSLPGKSEHPVFLGCLWPASSGNETLRLAWEVWIPPHGHKAFSFKFQ